MLKQVRTILTPPVFSEDEDKTRKGKYAYIIALAFLAVAVAFELFVRIFANYARLSILDLSLFVVALMSVASLVLLRHGYVRFTSMLLVVLVWVATNGLAATGYGAKDSSYLLNFAVILMAALLLSWQAALIITVISVFSGFALAYAEQDGWIKVTSYPITSFARDITFVFGLNGVFIYLLINGLENALKKSRLNLVQLESANASLSTAQSELQSRSEELTTANQRLENRTKKLHAIAMVTRAAAPIQNFDLLLASITSTVSKQLGYDHVGLFLLDENREFAILRSSNTDGGLRMVNHGYRVPVGSTTPVGLVAQTGQPRIFTSTPENAALFQSEDLPDYQSEVVLPLNSGEQLIGVLDIQTTETDVFTEDDLSILSILADQIAITIHNLLLYEQSQSALRRASMASRQASAEAWKRYEKVVRTKGYRYDGIKSEALKEPSNEPNRLSVPIQLRGQTIASFKLKPSDSSRTWTEDEIAMIEATAERVALALEGARLLEEAQTRAAREAFLSDVATKLSASFQLDSILRDTVQELGQNLGNSTVTFQLVNPSESDMPSQEKRDSRSPHNNGSGAGYD